ncbi:MAG TPA: hypothetical protein PKE38_09300 [Ignavibacteriaceae bacterium]|nr:hypothetical protein [Ignavibacteriaceae bacterium]
MEKLKFSTIINASTEKVWDTMLEDKTYRIWTEEFAPGSHYIGNWNQGSKIFFLGPSNDGKLAGMVSRIKENKLHKYISIEHLGEVYDGVEDTTSDRVKIWAGALENYTFIDKNGKTELVVDLDINEEFKEMFEDTWPKALRKLKSICEE